MKNGAGNGRKSNAFLLQPLSVPSRLETAMKKCFKCGRELPLSEFYAHDRMKEGCLGKCKECTRKDVRANRIKNIDNIREYDRKRFQNPERKAKVAIYQKRMRKRNPHKYKATNAVNNAIRDGRLTRPDKCSLCGKECKPEAHHPDYSKPLEVEWYCRKCHRTIHGALIGSCTTDSQMGLNFSG